MAEHTFEKDLKKLEQIVTALEEGGLSLDDSLKRFEEGIKLYQRCEKTLTEAEKKIEILTKNAEGKLEPQPFGDDGENEASTVNKSQESEEQALNDKEDEDEMLF